jgi:LCP family protein required for cell wall assembly
VPTSIRHRLAVSFRWLAVVLVVAIVAIGAYAWVNYQSFVDGITRFDALPADNPSSDSGTNILLIGDDHRPDGATAQELAELSTTADGGGTNTDTIMVLHINEDGKSSTLISLPRDSWVEIPGYGSNKINAAFAWGSQEGRGDEGGSQLLVSTVQNVTGLTIDHVVRISLAGFYDVAEALGPIEVCLNNAVDDDFSGVHLDAGVSTLSAQQALAFVRQRHGLPLGDLDRVVRQQYLMSVEADRLLTPSTLLDPGKLNSVLAAISGAIEADEDFDVAGLAMKWQALTGGKLQRATIPISGTPTIWANGGWVSIVEVDTEAMPAFIAQIEAPTVEAVETPVETASPVADVTVTVLNGGGVNGEAARNTDLLTGIGFPTGTPGTADSIQQTTIEYPVGGRADALAVAAYLPGAALVETDDVDGVTVILGLDAITVTTGEPSATPTAPADGTASPTPTATDSTGAPIACIN